MVSREKIIERKSAPKEATDMIETKVVKKEIPLEDMMNKNITGIDTAVTIVEEVETAVTIEVEEVETVVLIEVETAVMIEVEELMTQKISITRIMKTQKMQIKTHIEDTPTILEMISMIEDQEKFLKIEIEVETKIKVTIPVSNKHHMILTQKYPETPPS